MIKLLVLFVAFGQFRVVRPLMSSARDSPRLGQHLLSSWIRQAHVERPAECEDQAEEERHEAESTLKQVEPKLRVGVGR